MSRIFFSEYYSFLDIHSLQIKIYTKGHQVVKETHYYSQTLIGQDAREMEWFVNVFQPCW